MHSYSRVLGRRLCRFTPLALLLAATCLAQTKTTNPNAPLGSGASPMIMTPTGFTKFLNDDIAKWAKVVKISGAKVE